MTWGKDWCGEWRPQQAKSLDTSVDDLDFSIRVRNCLQRLHVLTLRQLTEQSSMDLQGAVGFGKTSLREVRYKLKELGLNLRGEP
jgi:DNA-directed RNA polymerase subunit alpha